MPWKDMLQLREDLIFSWSYSKLENHEHDLSPPCKGDAVVRMCATDSRKSPRLTCGSAPRRSETMTQVVVCAAAKRLGCGCSRQSWGRDRGNFSVLFAIGKTPWGL